MDWITKPQDNYIRDIVQTLHEFGVRFDGTTRKEASAFITKYAYYARDWKRVQEGKRPYWSLVANQPPRDEHLHKVMVKATQDHDHWALVADCNYDDYLYGFGY